MSKQERYLCFGLGKEEFAIPLLAVKEVLGMPELTPIPQAPSYFCGIMNLRGTVLSVVDLRLKLGIKASESDETSVILLDLGDHSLGIIVDRVNAVIPVSEEQIMPTPSIQTQMSTEYIEGVFRKDQGLILMLNVSKALSMEDKGIASRQLRKSAA